MKPQHETGGQMTAALAVADAGLSLLLAEMQALCAVMPGYASSSLAKTKGAPESRTQDMVDDAEAVFDNMPV